MNIAKAPAVCLALLLSVLSIAPRPTFAETRPAATQPTTQPASAAARRFFQRVNLLAAPDMEGRAPGTRGLDKARDYLVAELKRIGLNPAFDGSFTQNFTTGIGIVARGQSLHIDGQPAEAGNDFNALGFSESRAFDGEAVFVGYGIAQRHPRYDNYAHGGPDAFKDKVVIAYRYEPQNDKGVSKWTDERGKWTSSAHLTNKAQWAAEHGAAALLLVTPPSQVDDDDALRSTRQTAAAKVNDLAVMHISTDLFGRILKASGRDPDRAAPALQREADESDGATVPLRVRIAGSVELERKEAAVANVAGVLPGSGALAGEVIVVGAHYDHLGYGDAGSLSGTREIHPGADDNASGTAALLAIAENLTARPRAASRRTVMFIAFTAEERGLIGSSYLVKHFSDTGFATGGVAAMLNLDMVGRMDDRKLFVLGLGSGGGDWAGMITDAVKNAGLKPVTQQRAHGSSDHASFYRVNVPALQFFTGTHGDYHRPSDTADKINADGAVKIVEAVAAIAHQLATQPQRIAFDADGAREAGAMHTAFGGAFLGVMPDYATLDGDRGCGITGVTPGSPAEKAGLKADDLIIAWNQKKIGNVYNLTQALAKAKPDEKVTLTVKRDGNEVKIPVTLGRR